MQSSNIGYRRNGKKQACEPCRKGKLACDHGAPHCGRCTRRKMTNKCIYHPAPMTRGKSSSSTTTSNGLSSITPESAGSSGLRYSSPPRYRSIGVQASSTCPAAAEKQTTNVVDLSGNSQKNWKVAVYPRSARYYGPTSFSAVFSEHPADINDDLLFIGDDVRKHPGTWMFGQPLLGRERPNTPAIRRTHVLKALRSLPTQATSDKLLARFMSMHDSTMDRTMISHCISTLWSTFSASLDYPRADERLVNISDTLFNNEEIPLPPSPDDGIEWLDTFMGINIRFEMLGLLFAFFGMAYKFLQDEDPIFEEPENDGRDRKQSAWRMKECADVCLNMCDSAETVNFLVTALIFNVKVLESACTGDETYKIRKLNGKMVTSAISAGLHRLPGYANSKLTAASEYKRRVFSAVYCSDKTHSSLNGTPPLLGRLFCDIEPCLDLDPKAPYLPQEELAAAFNNLDANGWNTMGEMYQTTILRAKVQLSTIREEILQLSLGVNVNISVEIIQDLHQRCQQMFIRFPPQLQYYAEGKTPKETTGAILYEQAYFMLQYLQNTFLLHRVALARGFSNGQGLLETASEMLDICLMFWIKRDQLMVFTSGFDWIVTYYGVPSAGVLCIELLKQSSPHQNPNPVQFSRSEAIQKLTLFIGFLEWIRPSHGNFNLARRLRDVIKRVLDHVLEQGNRSQEQVAEGQIGEQGVFDEMLWPLEAEEDLEWLNTIDWTQGAWMDFSAPPA